MRDEHFATVFFGIIAVIIMFVVPVCLVGYNRRLSAETEANEIVKTFVENCRSTAYFTENDFQGLQTKLDALGCRWDVDVYHYSEKYEPNGAGGFYVWEEVHDSTDIAQALFPIGATTNSVSTYTMKYGDKIEVRAVSKSEFMGVNLVSLFVGGLENRIIVDKTEQIDNNRDF